MVVGLAEAIVVAASEVWPFHIYNCPFLDDLLVQLTASECSSANWYMRIT